MPAATVRRRAIRTGLAAAALALSGYLIFEPVLGRVGSQLVRSDPLVRSDAIFVLAGGTPDREIEAADLYAAGYAPRIVLTVEPEDAGYEVLRRRGVDIERPIDLRKRILRSLGVPDGALVVLAESPVASTRQEALLAGEWASSHGVARVIVVTAAMHTARASWIFHRLLAPHGVEVLARPVSHDTFRAADWWRDRGHLRDGVFEWQKLLFYYVVYRW